MDKRREALLKEIVENYIKSAKPIGSKSLCKKFKCSSATIRNEMADLRQTGTAELSRTRRRALRRQARTNEL